MNSRLLKRIAVLLIVALMCTVLIGCGQDTADAPEAEIEEYEKQGFVLITDVIPNAMLDNGFRALPEEWWHFTLENEPYPDTYFDFSVQMPGK